MATRRAKTRAVTRQGPRPAPRTRSTRPAAVAAAPRQIARRRRRVRHTAIRIAMLVIAFIGIGIASYLTAAHYGGFEVACTSKFNSCEQVQTSVYSGLAGVPVALLGLIGYVGIFASLALPEREATRLATLGLTLFGFGFSLYLTYREAFSLHEYCEWCLSSAGLMTVLFALAGWRYVAAPGPSQPPVAPR